MNTMTVGLFRNHAEAEPVERRLVRQGIKAEIKDHLWWETLWFVSKSSCCNHLEVPAGQFEAAETVLAELEREGALQGAIRCPDCGSLRVDYPQFTRKSLLTNFFMGLGAELRLIEKNFYCEDCHFTWPNEGTRPSRMRPNMAPYYFIEGVPQDAGKSASGKEIVEPLR